MGYNGLSRLSKIRQNTSLTFEADTGPSEGLSPSQLLPETRSEAGAEILVPERSAKKCPERSDTLTFIWSVTSCSLSTSERRELNGRKASDWLRLYAPKWGCVRF